MERDLERSQCSRYGLKTHEREVQLSNNLSLVKILREVDLFNRKVVQEFRREAATMQLLGNHPNVGE